MDWQAWNRWVFGGCRTIEVEANEHVFGQRGDREWVDAAEVRGMASMRRRAAIGGSAGSRSWSEGVLWEPADVDEVSEAATRTDARLRACRSRGGVGDALSRGLGGCGGGLRRQLGRSRAIELQQEAGLSGEVAFGRMPKAKVADLVEAGREHMLEEAAHELVALQGAGLPARRFAVLVADGDGALVEAEDAGVG